jgi:hypothetical protein
MLNVRACEFAKQNCGDAAVFCDTVTIVAPEAWEASNE